MTRGEALRELREFAECLRDGNYGCLNQDTHASRGKYLLTIADALAKPVAFPDWRPAETLLNSDEDLGLGENDSVLCEFLPGTFEVCGVFDRFTNRFWTNYHNANPDKPARPECDVVSRWAKIPTGEPPEVAKPEARLDWQPSSKAKELDATVRVIGYYADGGTQCFYAEDIAEDFDLDPRSPMIVRFARIPLPEGEDE
jgi:hypothetical protein